MRDSYSALELGTTPLVCFVPEEDTPVNLGILVYKHHCSGAFKVVELQANQNLTKCEVEKMIEALFYEQQFWMEKLCSMMRIGGN